MATAESIHFPTYQPQASAGKSDQGFISDLYAFMMAMMYAQIANSKNQSTVNTNQTSVANSLSKLSQEQSDKAQADLKTYMDAMEEASHQSWWQTLLGCLGAVFGAILAGLSGGACSFLVAAAIMVLMTVPTKDGATTFGQLDQALQDSELPSWACALIKTGIVIAATLVGNAAGASAEVGLNMLVSAAKAGGEAAAEDAAEVGATVAGDAAKDSPSFLSKVSDIGFNRAALASTASQMMFATNPFIDTVMAILDATDTGEEKKKLAAQIAGTILAIIAAIACDKIAASGGNVEAMSSLKEMMSPKTFKYTYAAIDATRAALNIGSGVFGIFSGLAQMDGADAARELGKAQGTQTVYQAALDMTTSMTQRDQQNYKSTAETFSMMNDRWDSYVESYAMAAEVLG